MASSWALDLFGDLVRCETRLYNHLDDRLRGRHGVVTSQYEFLRFVREHPGARVADLAAEFAVGVGATSKGVDRLERRGWLTRAPNPADRRSTVLVLSDTGLALLDEAEATVHEHLDAVMAAVPADDRAATARALAALRATLEERRLGTPTG